MNLGIITCSKLGPKFQSLRGCVKGAYEVLRLEVRDEAADHRGQLVFQVLRLRLLRFRVGKRGLGRWRGELRLVAVAVLHERGFLFVRRDVADEAGDLFAELLRLNEQLGPEVHLGEVRAEARGF